MREVHELTAQCCTWVPAGALARGCGHQPLGRQQEAVQLQIGEGGGGRLRMMQLCHPSPVCEGKPLYCSAAARPQRGSLRDTFAAV